MSLNPWVSRNLSKLNSAPRSLGVFNVGCVQCWVCSTLGVLRLLSESLLFAASSCTYDVASAHSSVCIRLPPE
jgi:hypothetical protein